MGTIHVETDGASDLRRVLRWLQRHRSDVVKLDDGKSLALGAPIAGARAVIVAAALHADTAARNPELGGVVRALANRSDAEPAKLVFEGRSPAGLPQEVAEGMASEVLQVISALIVDEAPMAEVA